MTTHYSFVVDRHGPYPLQAYYLARSLIELADVAAEHITAHVVSGTHPSVMRTLSRLGVASRRVRPFGHPHCNKLQQLAPLADVQADRVVLLDTDTFAVRALDDLATGSIQGKMVDLAVPPIDVVASLWADAGLALVAASSDVDEGPTVRGNFNGGLYVVPTALLPSLTESWQRWARWCLARLDRFGAWHPHVDQLSFAMAAQEVSLPVLSLPRSWNVPTHLGPVPVEEPPRLLHYHRNVDRDLLLLPTGDATVDSAIATANAAIQRWRSEDAVDHLYWSARASVHPGVGTGSYPDDGHDRERVRGVIRLAIDRLQARSLVDIGGGDGVRLEGVATGVVHTATDVAPGLEEDYRKRNPEAAFSVQDITRTAAEPADLAVCLDVTPWLRDLSEYRAAVRNVLESGRLGALISGLDAAPPSMPSGMAFHEPLIHTIESVADMVAFPLEAEGANVVYLVIRVAASANPRDVTAHTLGMAIALGRALPRSLLECVIRSRRSLGFFPEHLPRCLEYPWALERIRGLGDRRLRIADVGAGVNVLPLILSDDGHHVTTIDSHPIVRDPAARDAWNEWGYLDYGLLRSGVTSVQLPYETYETEGPFDVILSVSVIEHLPADLRRAWVQQMASQLQPGGLLLLTVDTRPMSRDLWGWSEGVEIEPQPAHGAVDDLLSELGASGFMVDEVETVAWLPTSRVGVAMIAATRVLSDASNDAPGRPRVPSIDHRPSRPRGRTHPDSVTVLVPAYRSTERLGGLLRSMAAQSHRHLIVRVSFDHAPGEIIPDFPPMGHVELDVVHQPERLGWVGNVNWLLSDVATPYLMLVPHDDQLTPTYVELAVRALEDDPAAVAAHGGLRFHGVRDGETLVTGSIRGTRMERALESLRRGPHMAGLLQRGVIRSDPVLDGVRFRTAHSDGQFANDLWAFEILLHGDAISIDGIWYDKYTDPGGLSRVFHARGADEKSAMLADNLGCLVDMLRDYPFSWSEQELIAERYADWLLGLQGNWNVLADEPDSGERSYREVRPALARFAARALLSVAASGSRR